MVEIILPILSTILIFAILILNEIKNNNDVFEDILETFIFSTGVSASTILSISLIVYALTDKIILNLSNDMLHLGIFIGGASILITSIKKIYLKLRRTKLMDNKD